MTLSSVAPLNVALQMFDCWRRRDLEGALALLSSDAVFRADCKSAPVAGVTAIRELWAGYMRVITRYECEVTTHAASGSVLFVERTEQLGLAGRELVLPIVAVFEFDEEGKVRAWRDYWDTSAAGTS
jgi:limonene-1,2-epoxide hydrolase